MCKQKQKRNKTWQSGQQAFASQGQPGVARASQGQPGLARASQGKQWQTSSNCHNAAICKPSDSQGKQGQAHFMLHASFWCSTCAVWFLHRFLAFLCNMFNSCTLTFFKCFIYGFALDFHRCVLFVMLSYFLLIFQNELCEFHCFLHFCAILTFSFLHEIYIGFCIWFQTDFCFCVVFWFSWISNMILSCANPLAVTLFMDFLFHLV